MTPEQMEQALAVIVQPEFWCRAKLFKALEAARVKGVLDEVLDEMEIPMAAQHMIMGYLEDYWHEGAEPTGELPEGSGG